MILNVSELKSTAWPKSWKNYNLQLIVFVIKQSLMKITRLFGTVQSSFDEIKSRCSISLEWQDDRSKGKNNKSLKQRFIIQHTFMCLSILKKLIFPILPQKSKFPASFVNWKRAKTWINVNSENCPFSILTLTLKIFRIFNLYWRFFDVYKKEN